LGAVEGAVAVESSPATPATAELTPAKTLDRLHDEYASRRAELLGAGIVLRTFITTLMEDVATVERAAKNFDTARQAYDKAFNEVLHGHMEEAS
jgi:hypothetical protein